jgi:hypothetical protein
MGNIGRNQPCPCGSGLKYKRCHGSYGNEAAGASPFAAFNMAQLDQRRAEARIREAQQGLGRPIIGFKALEHQFVAVGGTIYFSTKWKTFPDFLADYIKQKLSPDWGNAEIAKPLAERHPIMQWYDAYCRYQQEMIKQPGQAARANVTGIVACYLGLAYSLYLLDHNVELQARLLRRLKDPSNFQGAFYELIVANALIRAGFELILEDEADPKAKHCEFAATSRRTRKKYWVEAKMRAVTGILGKTEHDGGRNSKPLSRFISHLNAALAKPAADERLIFIDLNAEPTFDDNHKPTWHDRAVARLEQYEAKELEAGVKAYLFVTNVAFHRKLADAPSIAAVPFGLGMPDYNRPGYFSLGEIYRQRQKHVDAHHIGNALLEFTKFPSTFDGTMPSEAFGARSSRVKIGETYFFENVGEKGLLGTVTSATVNDAEKAAYIAITGTDGASQIIRQPMSDQQFADYKAHPDAYFGKIVPVSKTLKDRYELFEWFMETNKTLSKTVLLERLARFPNFEGLKEMNESELLTIYCEALVAAVPDPKKE